MFVILTLVILVAAFNIISGLVMLVKDKGHDIAILRTMGATRGMVLRIFLLTGTSIGLVGTLAGLALALAFVENIETIRQCPSGALSYSVGGAERNDPDAEPAIAIAPNGPYVVTGGPDLLDTTRGEGASTRRFTLCRCGGSKNKPFCDGSHWYNKFTDDAN